MSQTKSKNPIKTHITIEDPNGQLTLLTLAELLTDFQSNLEDAFNGEDSEISFSYASSIAAPIDN